MLDCICATGAGNLGRLAPKNSNSCSHNHNTPTFPPAAMHAASAAVARTPRSGGRGGQTYASAAGRQVAAAMLQLATSQSGASAAGKISRVRRWFGVAGGHNDAPSSHITSNFIKLLILIIVLIVLIILSCHRHYLALLPRSGRNRFCARRSGRGAHRAAGDRRGSACPRRLGGRVGLSRRRQRRLSSRVCAAACVARVRCVVCYGPRRRGRRCGRRSCGHRCGRARGPCGAQGLSALASFFALSVLHSHSRALSDFGVCCH